MLPMSKANQNIVNSDCAKAETFLRFFQSVYSDHGSCISPSVVQSNPLSTETLNLIEVSTTEVTTLLEELDCSKAPGPDNIPTVVLKRCASALAPSMQPFLTAALLMVTSYQLGKLQTYALFIKEKIMQT